jgi:hypothetical protein
MLHLFFLNDVITSSSELFLSYDADDKYSVEGDRLISKHITNISGTDTGDDK